MTACSIEKVRVPEGRRGSWSVERFALQDMSQTSAFGRGEAAAGTYTKLVHATRGIVMSDTPDEMRDHREAVSRARGSCLINGLGLGMLVAAVLKKPNVTDVTVVEIDTDVIALVGPSYVADRRLTIVPADAFAYQPPPGRRYAMVWHDIWDRISATNLASMATLMRKFQPTADWQGCWAEDLSIRCAAQDAPDKPSAVQELLGYLRSTVQPPLRDDEELCCASGRSARP